MKKTFIIGGLAILILGAAYCFLLAAPGGAPTPERFIVSLGETRAQTVQNLAEQGFIRSGFGFSIALALKGNPPIAPGGYKINGGMNAFQIASILKQPPYMEWVVVPEGLRKEETANLLQQALGWTDATKDQFLNAYQTLGGNDYKEGVYFPDTYLLPVDETGIQIAQRFITQFNESFAPYAKEAAAQNIKWTTALKIASIIQRESARTSDMALISGIIWNRLLKNMPLDIDATIQYARGDTGKGFWAPLAVADLKINSPYNTYLHAGLPPTPISNPGLAAINAALSPQTTTCLYYLHDTNHVIHCANTYDGQKLNIEKYLR